jgi:signal transduction histidine kinase
MTTRDLAPKARILLVDDHPENLLALRALLSPLGHELVCVQSGQEALEALEGAEFALILLDIRMPRMDGLETAARVREMGAGHTPIIFVAADASPPYSQRAYELGAADVLVKPIDPSALLAKVAVFIDLFHRGRRLREADAQRVTREEQLIGGARPARSPDEVERLQQENRWLREAVRFRDDLIAIAPAFFGFLSPEGLTMHINDLALQAVESPRDRVVGTLFWQAAWWAPLPQSAARVRDAITEAAAGRSSQFDVEYCASDGGVSQTRWVALSVTPSTDADGRVSRIAVTGTDITERRRVEDERARLLSEEMHARRDAEDARRKAELANHTKEEFLAVASHELRTPLNSILGWARILRGPTLDPAAVLRGLETIERNAKAQVTLIDDILDSSRVLNGKLHLEICAIDVISIVEGAVDAVRPASEAKEIAIGLALDPAAAHIRADGDRLQQVVWNLVNNAIKFTPRGGRVEVCLERVGPCIELSVRDDGEGISKELMPHLFERFRQGDASTTRRHGGLGLGLALVRHLVEAHGGSVHAESKGVGQGAKFVVVLHAPVAQPGRTSSRPPAMGPPQRCANEPTALGGVRVLVVDDEPDARDLVATVLGVHGAVVDLAESAQEAFALLERETPTVLISDIGMPDTDGYDLMRRVRAQAEPTASIPAVALTAYSREEDRRRALEAGFDAFLAKPVDPHVLVQMVLERARVAR